MKKIANVLMQNNVDSTDKIDSSLIQNIMNVINKDDLEGIVNNLQKEKKFNDILNTVKDKFEIEE